MKDIRFAKTVLLINSLVPGMLLLWDAWHGRAGANPVNYAIRTTGLLTLICLALTLLVSPLRKLTGSAWLFHMRRTLGLYAFFYALAHFSIFFICDRALNVRDTLSEMVKRPYLIVGSLGLLAMAPLAITSVNYMIRLMGPKRWQALHRLVYFAAIAGVVHFYMLVKSDIRLPVAFGIAIGILLGFRAVLWMARCQRKTVPGSGGSVADPALGSQRWSGQLRVDRIVQETRRVRTFRLVPTDGGKLPFDYRPGQYLTLSVQIDGKTVRRSYTIASTPTRRGYCEVTIKREEQGLVSRHMHDTVKEGDILSLAAPFGRFTFCGDGSDSVALLAAGVGITPLMSILRYLTDQNWSGEIFLAYSCQTVGDIIFRKEIEGLARQFPNVHLRITLTRADAANWEGATGRIDAILLTSMIPDVTRVPFYICGPSEMLATTSEILRNLGVADHNIRTESFGATRAMAATEPASLTNEQSFIVTFVRSNKAAAIDCGQPILALAEELGIEVDSECRSGICGRCKTRLLSGSVHMDTQEALDYADRQNNVILLCQAHALEDVTLSV